MRSLGVLLLILVTIVTAQENSSCINGDVDLIQDGGSSEIVGYVRYCWEGQWRSVCRQHDFKWNDNEARVACRQLGYQGNGAGYTCPSGVGDTPINETFIVTQCNAALNGTESSLQDCMIKTVDSCRCDRTARLQCDPVCTSGDLRLVPTNNSTPGNVEVCVEVCVGGRWGTLQTNYSGELAEYVCGSITQSPDLFITSACYRCCADHQEGQYRVENGTVLQECVDQQWRTVENTSQLLIDSFCPTSTEISTPTTCTECPTQADIDQLINETLTTQCPTPPPITETTSPTMNTCIEGQATFSPVQDDGSTINVIVIAILVVALLTTAVGWVITCVVVWKKYHHNTYKLRPQTSAADLIETNEINNYSLVTQNYEEEAPPTSHTQTAGPSYETVVLNEQMTYDRLQHNPQSAVALQQLAPPPAAEKSGDDVEDEHLYSVLETSTTTITTTENNNTTNENNNTAAAELNDVTVEKEPEHGEVEYANLN